MEGNMMRVLILGIDGYLGWSLAKHLAANTNYQIGGVDNYNRRDWVANIGGHSATRIARMSDRLEELTKTFGTAVRFYRGDMRDPDFVDEVIRSYKPDAVVHLAEQPSAPYSMMSRRACIETHENNVNGTLNLMFSLRDYAPDAHMIKLGTMGEYGTPNVDIPEGEFELEFRGRMTPAMFPRNPGSFYHATKIHDTVNTRLACRVWGLRATDIMQGVVYGLRCEHEKDDAYNAVLATRFDFDAVFGTAINRFCAQAAIDAPITVYGSGEHKRGFLPLRDAMQCLTIALNRPPKQGEYRTWNQFDQVYGINDLAFYVAAANRVRSKVVSIPNPREGGERTEEHHYNPDRSKLVDLGYVPTGDMRVDIHWLINDLKTQCRERIEMKRDVMMPDVQWNGKRGEQ
jgi:UDP-sulfoquinovose synthase